MSNVKFPFVLFLCVSVLLSTLTVSSENLLGEKCFSETCGPGEVCLLSAKITTERTASDEDEHAINLKSGIMIEVRNEEYDENEDYVDYAESGYCECDSAHEFSNDLLICVPKNFTEGMMREKFNTDQILASQVRYAFLGIALAGIMFVTITFICALAGATYCCKIKRDDHKLRNEVEALLKRKNTNFKRKTEKENVLEEIIESSEHAGNEMTGESEYVPAIILV